MLIKNTATQIEVVTAPKTDPVIKFSDVFTMDTLRTAYKHVRRGKALREKTIFYHMNLMKNLLSLLKRLEDGTYFIGRLSRFKVYEPKEREVIANQFEDKIVQDIIAKLVFAPLLSTKLIHDNYASQPGKGTHKALHRLERFSRIHAKSVDWTDDGYVMVGDMSKFFYNIDQKICWKMVKKLPIDEKLQKLIYDQITTCTPEINPYTEVDGKGLCIGFQTSQWLAVYYLDKLDHFIKEKLGIKCYGRYMDDFFLIHEDKEYLEYCFKAIKEYCEKFLDMHLNKKSYIHPFRQGVCFLGYHVTYNPHTHQVETHIRKKSINKMLKRTKKQVELIKEGKITSEQALSSLQSWQAYAKHGNDEKAMNAYEKAKKMIYTQGVYLENYRVLTRDWTNLDEDGFFKLKPRQDTVIRDVDGFAVLFKHKKSKRDAWEEEVSANVLDNQELYTKLNFEAILKCASREPDKYSKYQRKRYRKTKAIRGHIEAACEGLSRP